MVPGALERRILDFVRDVTADDFSELALALFEQQFESLPHYRQYCENCRVGPSSITDWREIPRVDASELGEAESLQQTDFQRTLVRSALAELFTHESVWLLIDTRSAVDANPLIDTLAGQAPPGSFVCRGQRLDAKQLRSWLGARQRDRRPVQIVTAAPGYASLIELLERRSLKFRLPPGSSAVCLTPINTAALGRWNDALGQHLGVAPEARRRILCGQASSTPLLEEGGHPGGSFRLPHWVRVTSSGSESLAILDLALIGTPAHRIEPVAARVRGDHDRDRDKIVLV